MTGGLRQGLPLETEVEKSRGRSASEQSLSSEKIGAEGWPFMAMADYLMMMFIDWENHVLYQWGYQIYQIRVSMSIIRIIISI